MANITYHTYFHAGIIPEQNSQVWVDLDHNESQRIGSASGLEEVATVLGSLAGAGPFAPFIGLAVYNIRQNIKDRDQGNGVRVVYTYWTLPVMGRTDVDVQTGHPDAPG